MRLPLLPASLAGSPLTLTVRRSFPIIFSGTGNLPPATPINYVPWVIVGFIFNYVIRRRHFGWWTKYNCALPLACPSCPSLILTARPTARPFARSFARVDVLSAGLDSGYAVGTLIIFFWCVRLATFVSIRPDPPSPFPFVSASLQYPLNGAIGKNTIQTWWGNTVYTNTADALGTPLRTLVTGKTFGPSTW